MNLEMPSPAEADSLRTILLIVLGVMILTIPVVFVIVLSRIMAQRKQRPSGFRNSAGASHSHDPGGAGPAMAAMGATHFAMGGTESSQDALPPPQPTEGEPPPLKPEGLDDHRPPMEDAASAVPDSASSSWWGDSSGADSGGSSFDSGSSGGGDSGGGGGGGSD